MDELQLRNTLTRYQLLAALGRPVAEPEQEAEARAQLELLCSRPDRQPDDATVHALRAYLREQTAYSN